MILNISGRNMDTGAAFQEHARATLHSIVEKYFSNAVVLFNCIIALYFSIRKKITTSIMDRYSCYLYFCSKYEWNIFSKVWNFKFCSYFCK